MTYAFNKNCSAETEALRVLINETEQALAELDEFEFEPHARIHKCRQGCKRARALLRLIRPANPYVFAIENRMFRDIARRLSLLRDQDAMLEAADFLVKSPDHSEMRESMLFLHDLLNESQVQERRLDDRELQAVVMAGCDDLRRAAKRYRDLSFSDLGQSDLQQTVESIIGKVKQGFRKASVTELDDDYHSWRKQTKYAQNQLALTKDYLGCWPEEFATGLRALAGYLGHHQDLTLLLGFVNQQRDTLAIDNRWNVLIADLETAKQMARGQAKEQAITTLFDPDRETTQSSADDIAVPGNITRIRGV